MAHTKTHFPKQHSTGSLEWITRWTGGGGHEQVSSYGWVGDGIL